MKHRIFNLAAAAAAFLLLVQTVIGIPNGAGTEQQNNWAAGFVSGQVYRIEFPSDGNSRFLACDAEGNLYLSAEESDENTAWTASSSFSHDFSLAANGFTLKWKKQSGSETPVLKADNVRKSIEDLSKKTEGSISKTGLSAGTDSSSYVPGQLTAPPPKPPDGPGGPGGPGDSGKSSEWVYSYQNGEGRLSGTLSGKSWYVTIDGETPGASQSDAQAAQVRLRTEGRGGGDIIKGAPSVNAPVILGNTQEAASKFSVTTQNIPAGAAPEYSWIIDGNVCSMDQELVISDYNALGIGVHEVQCEISFVDDYGTAFDQISWTSNFIVSSGVLDNSLLTFSDVHETFENIGKAIGQVMDTHNGKIPALVVCTGDWTNVHPSADADTVNEFHIPAMKAQIGGIDTVFVSGNHEPAETAVMANQAAGLGYDGSGLIFESDSRRQGTSSRNADLLVFGINYDDTAVKQDGKTVYSYADVYEKLDAFLSSLAESYNNEYILISSHSGLHVLGLQGESGADEWGGDEKYNLNMSADMVSLLNSYAEDYGMRFIFLFGHDHSKKEDEFLLKPGDVIVSTQSFADKDAVEQVLSFTYGHAGYLTRSINGSERFTLLTWNRSSLARNFGKIGNDTLETEMFTYPSPIPETQSMDMYPFDDFYRLEPVGGESPNGKTFFAKP